VALRVGAVDTATDAVTAVEAVTRESLAEMRQVLGVLRTPGAAPAQPAPGLQDVGALVARTAAAGCVVSTEVTGDVSGVPASVSLAAYRILQESLTNVVKHAAGAAVTVGVAASRTRSTWWWRTSPPPSTHRRTGPSSPSRRHVRPAVTASRDARTRRGLRRRAGGRADRRSGLAGHGARAVLRPQEPA
jgi:hypothetical protein